ncbi:MAG: HNH endonuclease [Elusimicrobiota bacterium]
MSNNLQWREAVKNAIVKVVKRHNDPEFSRQTLIDEEIDYIKKATGSEGKTPEQTLSRNLQELWKDENFISHLDTGVYKLIKIDDINLQTVDITDEDVREEDIDDLIKNNKLVFPKEVDVAETKTQQKVRIGQQKLRELSLDNYNHECAFCDIHESDLLISGHIARWSDDKKYRGSLENVICMCEFHDPLFEHGYFTLTKDLEIELHPRWKNFSRPVVDLLDKTNEFKLPEVSPNKTLIMKHRNRCGYEVEE